MPALSQARLLILMGAFDILLGLGLAWWGGQDGQPGLQWAGVALGAGGILVVGIGVYRSNRINQR